jgi:HK97 family phage prohead protease
MNRAYSTLEIKSVDEDLRVIEGIASTPQTDRVGDVVEPKGAQFSLPMPLLWMHRAGEPIGRVTDARPTAEGIHIKAKIEKDLLPRIDEAWALIKSGLVRGLSVGFRSIKQEPIKDSDSPWATRFLKWEWLELSAVTIPANADLQIASSGAKSAEIDVRSDASLPGVPGKLAANPRGLKAMKTTTERISEFEAKRMANAGRMAAIMEKSNEDGSTLDAEQTEEYDTLTVEIKSIDEHIVRLKQLENVQIAKATEPTRRRPATRAAARSSASSATCRRARPSPATRRRWQ